MSEQKKKRVNKFIFVNNVILTPFLIGQDNKTNHFVHCPSIWGFWAAVTSFLGIDWVCPLRASLLLGWTTYPIRKNARKLWKTASLSLFWAIWKERNKVVFDFSPNRLKLSFINSLISWARLIYEGDYSIVRLLLCIL